MPPHVAASSREPLACSDVVPVAKARRLCRETNHARLPGNHHRHCSDNWLRVHLRLASDRFADNRPDDDRPNVSQCRAAQACGKLGRRRRQLALPRHTRTPSLDAARGLSGRADCRGRALKAPDACPTISSRSLGVSPRADRRGPSPTKDNFNKFARLDFIGPQDKTIMVCPSSGA